MSKYKPTWQKKYYHPVTTTLFDSPETKRQWNARIEKKRREVRERERRKDIIRYCPRCGWDFVNKTYCPYCGETLWKTKDSP